MAKINFQKEALENLQSPNQFDAGKNIAQPQMWVALFGIFLLVSFTIVWAFVGRIPVKVDAYGIFYLSGRISEIASEQEGILQDIFVREGQAVSSGQLLASIQLDKQCDLNSSMTPNLEIRAPYAGMVMGIFAFPISHVRAGDKLFLLFPLGIPKRDLVGLAFVSVNDGKKIKLGMKTEMELSSVRVEQHGKMLGKVTGISDLPTNKEEVLSIVKNNQLANAIGRRFKVSPFFVKLKPDLKPNSITGYQWTLKEPEHPIDSGTVFEAQIIIRENRPIDYVIPLFERML